MASPPDPDEHTRRLVAAARDGVDPTAWFEHLYAEAEHGRATVPWDWGVPESHLVQWAEDGALDGSGRRALVVGSGLGDDAEFVAGLGFDTVAFDVSPSAVRAARRRFPDSRVRYLTADLLDPPPDWREAFDLVVESYTVQSLPDPPRRAAILSVAGMVGPGGTLVVVATARDEPAGEPQGPPWPLTRAEIEAFAAGGLGIVRIESLPNSRGAGPGHWRAELHRAAPAR